jgi:hypothetical protein
VHVTAGGSEYIHEVSVKRYQEGTF